jgi:hypothetical protein
MFLSLPPINSSISCVVWYSRPFFGSHYRCRELNYPAPSPSLHDSSVSRLISNQGASFPSSCRKEFVARTDPPKNSSLTLFHQSISIWRRSIPSCAGILSCMMRKRPHWVFFNLRFAASSRRDTVYLYICRHSFTLDTVLFYFRVDTRSLAYWVPPSFFLPGKFVSIVPLSRHFFVFFRIKSADDRWTLLFFQKRI